MSGGRGLLWTFFSLLFFAVAVWADDTPNSKNSDTTANSSSPPKTKAMPVEESLHGHTIVDKYRWLEDSKDPEVDRARLVVPFRRWQVRGLRDFSGRF